MGAVVFAVFQANGCTKNLLEPRLGDLDQSRKNHRGRIQVNKLFGQV